MNELITSEKKVDLQSMDLTVLIAESSETDPWKKMAYQLIIQEKVYPAGIYSIGELKHHLEKWSDEWHEKMMATYDQLKIDNPHNDKEMDLFTWNRTMLDLATEETENKYLKMIAALLFIRC